MTYETFKRDVKHSYYAYPDDIATALCKLSGMDRDNKHCESFKNDLIDAIYDISAIAENQYNSDFWRTFYSALVGIAEKLDEGYINIGG